jgi:prophage antirepressor-like protein
MNTSAAVPFRFESHEVRGLNINGEPWFIAKDVCEVLEHTNHRMAVDGLDDDEKGVRKVYTLGGEQEMIVISESGLYTLIIRSNKPQAKPFRKWVTAEVLPSIRKTGAYIAPDAGGRKYSSFRHHHRTTAAPRGLDIRYTLDLTKIITKPSRQTLELLQRLTGVTVSDLAEVRGQVSGSPYSDREEIMALIDRFAMDHLMTDPQATVLFRDLYSRFVAWYGEQGFDGNYIPSLKAVSAWCDRHNYPRRKPSGRATVYGVTLRATEVEA